MKLIPVATGMIKEKLAVESALNKAIAERIIIMKAIIKGAFSKSRNQSLNVVKLLPFNCNLIKAAPVTLKVA